jgi:hypothetical protein
MKPEIKAAFKKAAQQCDARIAAQEKAKEQRNSDREEFEARWYSVRQDVVVPALEQIRDELRLDGRPLIPFALGNNMFNGFHCLGNLFVSWWPIAHPTAAPTTPW